MVRDDEDDRLSEEDVQHGDSLADGEVDESDALGDPAQDGDEDA